jgi:ligand-binding sensor domain-containing protein
MHLRLLIAFHLLIFISVSTTAQNGGYSLSRSFTVADGLPSNHIYNCMEDNQGFLWLATDAGIARFDGKHFQTFTTKDGLPDDEVLDIVKENNGRIWVSCFKQSPAYFDEVKNRFINANEDTNLAQLGGTKGIHLTALKDGGVMYRNENGSYFFVNGKLTHLFIKRADLFPGWVVQKNSDGSFISLAGNQFGPALYYIKDEKIFDSLNVNISTGDISKNITFIIQDNKCYINGLRTGICKVLSNFQINPLQMRIDSVSIDEPVFTQRITPKYFTVVGNKGNIFLFDKKALRLQFVLNGNYSPNTIYDDSKENIWVCSADKGLILYKKKLIETYAIPDNFTNTHFLSLARKPNGALLAGNYYGQVVETDGKYFIVHKLFAGNSSDWERKIIVSQNKIFSFSELGAYINFTRPVLGPSGNFLSLKTAAVFNDSIIIGGEIGRLSKINVITEKRTSLPTFVKRSTCIAVAPGNIIYHGSTDGLYKFDYEHQQDTSLAQKHPLLAERIVAICPSPDNYVWVATASKGILALRDDSVVKIFSTGNGIINNTIKCICSGRPGEIWVGTNNGISIIRYTNTPANFTYQNLTINDGLCNNTINEMLYSNDSVYCATGNGICVIPAGISMPQLDIPVRLTSITINDRDTSVADNYKLDYNQNNIQLQFAGIDLGGHFNYFQYRIDDIGWQKLETNTLTLQLNSGKHSVAIRAVDVNGNAGTRPLSISFTIATPFWKALWFWILLMVLSGSIIVWFFRKRGIAKREAILQVALNQKRLVELELQSLRSQINPHFIFNCLNSIKLLNHQQKHGEAEKYLDSFAALLRSALEQSSLSQITLQQEIDFIENYLSLEKLRLPNKLSYTVETGKTINPSSLLIPSMLLQPYIENAVKHGIAPLQNRQGLVQVRFYIKDDSLIAEVEDNGNGIDKQTGNSDSTGIGIENTVRRSKLYDIESRVTNLKLIDVNLSGTLVQLKIPVQQK